MNDILLYITLAVGCFSVLVLWFQYKKEQAKTQEAKKKFGQRIFIVGAIIVVLNTISPSVYSFFRGKEPSSTDDLDPRNAAGHANLATTRSEKGGNDRAIADHAEAVRLDPRLAATYNDRGIAWLQKGDNDRAILDFNMAVQLDRTLRRDK